LQLKKDFQAGSNMIITRGKSWWF